MRVVGVLAALILVAAAWLVPLPLQIAEPSLLVAAKGAVEVTISERFISDAALHPEPVDGVFLGVAQVAGPSLVQVVTAAVSGSRRVLARRSPASTELQRPEVIAAVLGLGLSPTRLEGTPLPVTVRVAEPLHPASLGAVLHAFDSTSALDVAGGRRVLGIGTMAADQSLACPAPPASSLAAAREAQIDIVLLPAACGPVAGPPQLRVVTVDTLTAAIDALLGVT